MNVKNSNFDKVNHSTETKNVGKDGRDRKEGWGAEMGSREAKKGNCMREMWDV